MRHVSCLLVLTFTALAGAQGNLLRNGAFQDDWQTLLPELKNHHWNYTTEVFNRRDYNPDGWRLSGKWEWRDADQPHGQRRLILAAPSKVVQSVNWVTIYHSVKLSGWPDAGGFPSPEPVRAANPLTLVRDLTCRVKLSATALPAKAATLTVAWSDASPIEDPLGGKRSTAVSVAVPEGTYKERLVEVKLPVLQWLVAAQKEVNFLALGAQLPMAATCEIVVADKHAGLVELHEATLDEPGSTAPNLLANGGFEKLTEKDPYPLGWSGPRKYRYFPPGVYYIFNTWHNSNSRNRGVVEQDSLVRQQGRHSLKMLVPSGDEVCVVSDPIALNQTAARLIEVRAWVKTSQLAMMQIDAEDELGRRLDGFNFIHKAIPSVGSDDWRQVRQVFRPATPLQSLRLKLCARGMNGFTLDDTGHQPQQNATGVIWWDDVRVCEPQSTVAELTARKVALPKEDAGQPGPHVARLELGDGLLGRNELTAEVVNPGRTGTFVLGLDLEGAKTQTIRSDKLRIGTGERKRVVLSYTLGELGAAYQRQPGLLYLLDHEGRGLAATELDFSTWTVPLDLELGALYLRPGQKQFVRANLGLSAAALAQVKELRLEVLRRGTGAVLQTVAVPATPAAILAQRSRIPDGMRDDFRNLVVTDVDVSSLPLQPFNDPQRNWIVRATVIDVAGKPAWTTTSQPFCRLAHDGPQEPIRDVQITAQGDFLINGNPWMPWGVTYGHNPVYEGPTDSGKFHNLANLTAMWSIYDRHGGTLSERAVSDANCLRHVETKAITPRAKLEEMWQKGLYASTVFLPPEVKLWPADYLTYLRTAPMVAAVSRGPEEAFGTFSGMTTQQRDALAVEVNQLRQATGKPVMVGHGGYWTRLEFERVPFFDIYDPETEPWYPAPLHTDLTPLVEGQRKVVWLRPQMYESVPYERWRYHVFVELMRGARGWQVAHGSGDASTFRGLHAELRHLQATIYSKQKPPVVSIEPDIEHLVRRVGKRTVIVAATTHGLSFGNWRWSEEKATQGRVRESAEPHIFSDESDGYHALGGPRDQNLTPHGIQNIVNPRKWPAGSKLVTWVKLDAQKPPTNLVALVKADGRWTHAAAWGKFNVNVLRDDNPRAFWFLRTFYRHARGFLGWGNAAPPHTLAYIPSTVTALGELPRAGEWVKLEVPLEKVAATGKLLDGIGFLHEGGRVFWAHTVLVAPDGTETVVFGAHEDRPDPEQLGKTKIVVAGLKKGTKVRVLFEDRELTAEEGYFVDDFRGVDLYQRYGGERSGYGNAPVALHIYDIVER